MMRHRVTFRPRPAPLEPCAVLARGDVVPRLVERLRDRTPFDLGRLRGVHGSGFFVLTGAADALPWCEGVRYFGRDPSCAPLLLPIELEPDVPGAWLRALVSGTGARLVVPEPEGVVLVPLDWALTVDPECLRELGP